LAHNFYEDVTQIVNFRCSEKALVHFFTSQVIQLYETMLVRHGVMLVGPTGGGKTTVYRMLAATLARLHKDGHDHPQYKPVKT